MLVHMKRIPILLSVSVAMLIATAANGQSTLVWSDEFDGTTLNSDNWTPNIGNGHDQGLPGWGNNELEYYTARPENLFVADGYCHIVAREESYEGFSYTSAKIDTRYKHDFQYGRLEARIKLPEGGAGIWPAFWMMPEDSPYGGWASCGEIDIMETVGIPTTVHGTLHFGGSWPDNTSYGGDHSIGESFANDFHVYAIEWSEDEIRWYVDGVHFLTATSNDWWSEAAPSNPRAPFDSSFYFILNLAVGGNWPGYPNDSTPFPQEMLIDWVRVYDSTNEAPTVDIVSPEDEAELEPGSILFVASAEDTDGSIHNVEFYVNDVLIHEDDAAPYMTHWNATNGCYRLKVVATDDQGWTATDEIAVRVGEGCVGVPYLGYPTAIPGVLEVENYDVGGEGVAYHDCDSTNNGGEYRPSEGVDLEDASSGSYNIGWMCNGEWLNYTVDVHGTGYYVIEALVASRDTGGTFRLEFDGVNVTGDVDVPVTGGWQDWETVTASGILQDGTQVMRFVNESGSGEFNIDSVTFTGYDLFDFDLDGDVDLLDWAVFEGCVSGAGSSAPLGSCDESDFSRSDVDLDDDVDLEDLAVFQSAFEG